MSEFNKEKTLDEFAKLFMLPPEPIFSDQFNMIVRTRNFLEKIHNDAFEQGFEKGLEANKTIDNLKQ